MKNLKANRTLIMFLSIICAICLSAFVTTLLPHKTSFATPGTATWSLGSGASLSDGVYTLTGEDAKITTNETFSDFTMQWEVVENSTLYNNDTQTWGIMISMGSFHIDWTGYNFGWDTQLLAFLPSNQWPQVTSVLAIGGVGYPDGSASYWTGNGAGKIWKLVVSGNTMTLYNRMSDEDWTQIYTYTNQYVVGTSGTVSMSVVKSGTYSITDLSLTAPQGNTVTFMVDGEEYDTVFVEEGGTAVLSKANPKKAGYTFNGWDGTLENITEDTVVNAIFEMIPENPDFTCGEGAVYSEGIYTLTGAGASVTTNETYLDFELQWEVVINDTGTKNDNNEGVVITIGNNSKDYNGQTNETPRTTKIYMPCKLWSAVGSVLRESNGLVVDMSRIDSFPNTAGYSYRLTVSGHTLTLYQSLDKETWTEIYTFTNEYIIGTKGTVGISVVYGTDAGYAMTDGNTATYSITDLTLTAPQGNTVTFMVDGEEYDTVFVEEGGTAVLSKADPKKAGYTFNGWDGTLENITEDTVVNAIFEMIPENPDFTCGEGAVYAEGIYTLTGAGASVTTKKTLSDFILQWEVVNNDTGTRDDNNAGVVITMGKNTYDYNGFPLEYSGIPSPQQTVLYLPCKLWASVGNIVTETNVGVVDYSRVDGLYNIAGYSYRLTVSGHTLTLYQSSDKETWTEIYTFTNEYIIGTIGKVSISVLYGTDAGYAMTDGNTATYSITDLSLTAQQGNTVTFMVDGEEYDTVFVEEGGTAVLSKANPKKAGYTFNGWDGTLENITEDTVVNAIFEMIPENPDFTCGEGAVYSDGVYILTGEGAKITTKKALSDFELQWEVVENSTLYNNDTQTRGVMIRMGNFRIDHTGYNFGWNAQLFAYLPSSQWPAVYQPLAIAGVGQPDDGASFTTGNGAGKIWKLVVSGNTMTLYNKDSEEAEWTQIYTYTNQYVVGTQGAVSIEVVKGGTYSITDLRLTYDIKENYTAYSDTIAAYINDDPLNIGNYADGTVENSLPLPYIIVNKNSKGIVIGEKSNLSDGVTVLSATYVELYNLKTRTRYYYRVINQDGSLGAIQSFVTDNGTFAPRMIYCEGTNNFRDLGGYYTENGIVRQGLIYRSSRSNQSGVATATLMLTENGLRVISELGIKSEIDLRRTDNNEVGGLTDTSVLGAGINYVQTPMADQGNLITLNATQVRDIFVYLSDSSHYPVVYHCHRGVDRTGFVSYLILGLLGVSEEDIYFDYLFSNFSGGGNTDIGAIVSYVDGLNAYGGDTLSAKIENYLLDIGVTSAQINAIKSIMIEPLTYTADVTDATCDADGVIAYTCIENDLYNHNVVISKLGHQWEKRVVDDKIIMVCERCGKESDAAFITGQGATEADGLYTLSGKDASITSLNEYSNFVLEWKVVRNTTLFNSDTFTWGVQIKMGNLHVDWTGYNFVDEVGEQALYLNLPSSQWPGINNLFIIPGVGMPDEEYYQYSNSGYFRLVVNNGTLTLYKKDLDGTEYTQIATYSNEYIIGTKGTVSFTVIMSGTYAITDLSIVEFVDVSELKTAIQQAEEKLAMTETYTAASLGYLSEAVASVDIAELSFLSADYQSEVDAKTATVLNAIDALEYNRFTVTFKVDGEDYDTVTVEYGKTAVLSETEPVKEGYNFKGWDISLDNICADTVANAVFEVITYTVTFKVDGEVYDTVIVEYGKTAEPSKADPVKIARIFSGWDVSLENITKDTVANATFEYTMFVVTFKVDGEVYDTVTVERGETAVPSKTAPVKEGYAFKGWDISLENVTEDRIANATFEKTSEPAAGCGSVINGNYVIYASALILAMGLAFIAVKNKKKETDKR